MPQIDQIGTIYFSQLFWLLVVFALIYFIIGRWMLPRIEGTIHARNDRIAADLAEAERARAEAATIEADYNREMEAAHVSARADVSAATQAAAADSEGKAKANNDALEAKIVAATADLDAARTSALGQIEGVAAEAVREIVKLVSGIDVDETAASTAVRRQLEGAAPMSQAPTTTIAGVPEPATTGGRHSRRNRRADARRA